MLRACWLAKDGFSEQDLQGFWRAQKQVVVDVWTVLHEEEQRAVRMALWIALIDQGMGSTAVLNYSVELLERAGMQGHATATAWSSSISASKVLLKPGHDAWPKPTSDYTDFHQKPQRCSSSVCTTHPDGVEISVKPAPVSWQPLSLPQTAG